MTERAAPKKPALLKGGMIVCWVYGAVLALYLAMTPLLEQPPAGVQLDTQFINASRLFIIPLLVMSILVAYGLAKDRYWSRGMMMTLLILGVVLVPPGMASATMYAMSGVLAAGGWWYLYRKKNVVEYYATLRPKKTAN